MSDDKVTDINIKSKSEFNELIRILPDLIKIQRMAYEGYLKSGFTEDQALSLIGSMFKGDY